MTGDDFWALVEASRTRNATEPEEQIGELRGLLQDLSVEQLLEFQQHLHGLTARANLWRLWAAGYLAAGGMSDDAFDYFRLWSVLQGRDTFERLLTDADHLAELDWDEGGEAFDVSETLAYLVPELLDERGVDPGDALLSATAGGEPAGAPFDEDDEAWFAATFPRLSERSSTASEADQPSHSSGANGPDATVFFDWTSRAKPPRELQPMAPLLAAVLYENGEIAEHERPMLAAYWLADGLGGDAVLELASLRGNEAEVNELWPLALAEMGVSLPVTRARVAAVWAAQRVLDRERDSFWLAEFLRPRSPETSDDPGVDQLARELYAAVLAGRAVRSAVEALARDDVASALVLLEERER